MTRNDDDDEISGEGMSVASYHAFKAMKARVEAVKDDVEDLLESHKGQRTTIATVAATQNEMQVTMGQVLLQLKIHTWLGAAIGSALIVSAVAFIVAIVQAHIK